MLQLFYHLKISSSAGWISQRMVVLVRYWLHYGLVSLFVQLESTYDRRLQETLFIIGMSCKMENIIFINQLASCQQADSKQLPSSKQSVSKQLARVSDNKWPGGLPVFEIYRQRLDRGVDLGSPYCWPVQTVSPRPMSRWCQDPGIARSSSEAK